MRVGFQIFSQSYDLLKNSFSLVTQIYAMQDGSISLIKRFFDSNCDATLSLPLVLFNTEDLSLPETFGAFNSML